LKEAKALLEQLKASARSENGWSRSVLANMPKLIWIANGRRRNLYDERYGSERIASSNPEDFDVPTDGTKCRVARCVCPVNLLDLSPHH
jgi:hypothetical protein